MTLLGYEWRKLARMSALWVFAALCLLFNIFYVSSAGYNRRFVNETSQTAARLGSRVDAAFLEGLSAMDRTKNQDLLLTGCRELTDVFAFYDTAGLTESYRYWLGDSLAGRWIGWKYELLSPRAAHLSQSGASMDLYAGPATANAHSFLFGDLMRFILGEAAILGMLSTLALLGHEEIHRTTQTVCASRTGRRLFRWKLGAGVAAAMALYLAVAAVTLGTYFALFDYSGIWNSSISSGFNQLTDMLIPRPVLTWADFTVGGYLAAVLALGAVLTAVLALLAGFVWVVIRRVYLAALVLMVVCLGGLVVPSVLAELDMWTAYALCTFEPVIVLLNPVGWFTEQGMNAFIPWQETAVTASWLALLGGGTAALLKRMDRKDVPA